MCGLSVQHPTADESEFDRLNGDGVRWACGGVDKVDIENSFLFTLEKLAKLTLSMWYGAI